MHVPLREPLKNTPAQNEIIEKMIKRYSITYVPNRGVSLFDIVGFSLLTPFEQMMQLNSLSYSLNSAQAKLLTKRIGVDFSRTTTGDGFYIWNRNLTSKATSTSTTSCSSCSPTTRLRTRRPSTTPCRGCARVSTSAAATSSTKPKG